MSEPNAPSIEGRVAARLARLSFRDAQRAAELLTLPCVGWWDITRNAPPDESAAALVAALGRTADPDAALAALAEMLASPEGPELRLALQLGSQLRSRLLPVLGVSVALAEHLVANPSGWRALVGDYHGEHVASHLADAVGASADAPVTGSGGLAAQVGQERSLTTFRSAYRHELVAIAGRDLSGEWEVAAVTAALADLAGHTLQAALAVARAGQLPGPTFRLAVIAMGKTGGRELNYVSDVDVVFVAEPGDGTEDATAGLTELTEPDREVALAAAAALAAGMMRICRAVAWEVDAALRPEGKDGALVRTLASHEAYYTRWASSWEFQALFKARAIAGDMELGRRYEDVVAPFVWTAAERDEFVQDVRAMRRRVIENIPAAILPREIKLGPGGLRDVEFAVQLLQLVHGRGDESLHVNNTLDGLAALRDGGYVGRDDAVSLADAYTFLRVTEHRLQLRKLRRTHLVPEDGDEREWLARALGFRPDRRGTARDVWESEWALHVYEVRRLHEKLFYRPLLEAVARVPSAQLRLTPGEAGRRLAALGFADPDAALRHIEALTTGLSRRAQLQRTLLPAMLNSFAESPDPDRGLLAYRQVSDQLGETPWYLRLLRDGGAAASRFAYLLGSSRYISRLLLRMPEGLRMLADSGGAPGRRGVAAGGDELTPRKPGEILAAMLESASRHDDPAEAVAAVRGLRRGELLRTAFADLLGQLDVTEICEAISANTEATLAAVLAIAENAVAREHDLETLPIRFAIIAMGRLGGSEVGYGSDADLMFVYDLPGTADGDAVGEQVPEQEHRAAQLAHAVAETLRALLASPSSADPPLNIDADLRPEGRNGPLVRTLASYAQYYARWSSPWEAQALLRARFCAGDAELGAAFTELIDSVRYPAGGISQADLLDIRRVKARVDSERLPRGADPATHTKLGRGGLADIEWTIQLIQLEHAHAIPALRTTRTLDALWAAAKEGLLTREQAETLASSWREATVVRNALMLVRDRAEDQLPHQGRALTAIGRAMGYQPGFDPGQVIDDYRRIARRARRVVEEVFYGPLS
ncbi:MAG TPA: bifunctional [glutamine synthetase] adenylyltransferase/[glutamine synthetase]-adenylyl-L-tyrosine phosphorylase [Jatrophihabitans sp.]|jgi:glutamate-ammonia-ligase adenylyltransferase